MQFHVSLISILDKSFTSLYEKKMRIKYYTHTLNKYKDIKLKHVSKNPINKGVF